MSDTITDQIKLASAINEGFNAVAALIKQIDQRLIELHHRVQALEDGACRRSGTEWLEK